MAPQRPQVGVGEWGGEESEGEEEGELVQEGVVEDGLEAGHGLVVVAQLFGGQGIAQSLEGDSKGHLASRILPLLKK